MDLIALIHLVEQGEQNFYDHLQIQGQEDPAELYWIDREWRFRPFAYRGEWVILKHPLDLKVFYDVRALGLRLTDFLLLEFYYYELFNLEDKILRKKTIQNHFGTDRCEQYKIEMELFQEALTDIVKRTLTAPPRLSLIKK